MEEIKYDGNFVKVTEEELQGAIWERIYLHDSLVIFPIDDKGNLYLIKEKRPHETPNIRIKYVTGHIDKGEDPAETANRELQEEVGFKSNKLTHLMTHQSSGTINSKFYYFLAEDLEISKLPNPDGEDCIMEVIKYPFSEIKKLLIEEKLPWTLATLGLFKILINSNKV